MFGKTAGAMTSQQKTVRMWHENLAALRGDGTKLPLSELKGGDHLHGGLRIEIGGRLIPDLGYFGPDDVCFNTWLTEMEAVARILRSSDSGQHTFDEGEQGQPAYVFERVGDRAYLTIGAGSGGGSANPTWQHIEFSPEEFLVAHKQFCESFLANIRAAAPKGAPKWIFVNAPKT